MDMERQIDMYVFKSLLSLLNNLITYIFQAYLFKYPFCNFERCHTYWKPYGNRKEKLKEGKGGSGGIGGFLKVWNTLVEIIYVFKDD
jgi:hypothetical protein